MVLFLLSFVHRKEYDEGIIFKPDDSKKFVNLDFSIICNPFGVSGKIISNVSFK
jgi:hypothetical protein